MSRFVGGILKLIIRRGKTQSIQRTVHYNVTAKQAFQICKNYESFLKVMLNKKEGPFNLKWVKKGPGEVGGTVRYGLTRDGRTNTIEEEVTQITEDHANNHYAISWKNTWADPMLAPFLKGYESHWHIKPAESSIPGKPLCSVTWTQAFPAPLLFGVFPLTTFMKRSLQGTGSHISNFVFRQFYEQEFPSTNRRLPRPGEKVAIVGAGPSGLHMAHLLKNKAGIYPTDITILERSDRYGGKTVSIEDKTIKQGVVHELGTCYLHPAYFAVRAYVQELKHMLGGKAPPGFGDEVAPENYNVEVLGQDSVNLPGWVSMLSRANPRFSLLGPLRSLFPNVMLVFDLYSAKTRYNKLHRQHFGEYDYSMPPQLDEEKMKALDMSFGQFLENNNLTTLTPLLAYGNTAQGYGDISSVPAFWAMCWLTPDLMDGYMKINPNPARKAMFKHGWLQMWDATIKANNLNIRFGTDIDTVTRNVGDDQKVVITGTRGDEKFEEEYDYLVIGAPLYDKNEGRGSAWDELDGVKNKTVPMDLTEKEKAILKDPSLSYSQFRTLLFRLKYPQPWLHAHLDIFSERLIGPTCGHGYVFATRDSYLALNPELCTDWEKHQNDPMRGHLREQMAYQWVDNDKDLPLEFFNEKFDAWVKATYGLEGEAYDMLEERHWNYFSRYGREGLFKNLPWKVLELQGANKTLFVHASTFFESVLDIINYNNMLVDGLQGKLNDVVPPQVVDPEVIGSPPKKEMRLYEKPQFTQTDHWKIWYNPVIRMGFRGLDLVLNGIWTLLYIPISPIWSRTITRYQRYHLQTAFKTENPGKWYQYSMSHFLKVSPSVICYRNNTLDPVIRDSRDVLEKEHPEIPKVDHAMMLSYSDFRTVMKIWMDKVQPSFLGFVGPKTKSMIENFALYYPVTYNYFASWGLVVGFNLLTGYSYRVEDEKGGGCYVPRCEMLEVSRKEYGDEMGCKICTHVCKVFTEEAMARKGMPVTLEPNFVKGSCMIRCVKPQSPAFHDHTLFDGMKVQPEQTNPPVPPIPPPAGSK